MTNTKKIMIGLVAVLLISASLFLIVNQRKKNFVHDINDTLEAINLEMVEDNLRTVAEFQTNPPSSFIVDEDDYLVYHSSDTTYLGTDIYDSSKMNHILSSTGTLFKQLSITCGLPNNEYNECTYEDRLYITRFEHTDDSMNMEIYEPINDGLKYYKITYQKDTYVNVYEATKNDNGTFRGGSLYLYTFDDSIIHYELSGEDLTDYSHFMIAGYYDFAYEDTSSYSPLISNHITTFTNTENHVEYTYGRTEDTQTLDNYRMVFYDDYSNDFTARLTYEQDTLTQIDINPDYVNGWDDFYNEQCSVPAVSLPYRGICETSHSDITIKLEDYPHSDISELLSLNEFDLSFTEVTKPGVTSARQYFDTNYDTIYTEKDFDYTNLTIYDQGITDIITFDPDIESRFLD